MTKIYLALTLLACSLLFAQKPCEYSANIKDSIGTYKATKEYLMYEKNFAGNKSYIFYSLTLTDGTPALQLQLIQKSKDFLKADCFDKNTKLFLQLNNGKIISLVHLDKENCGTMIRDLEGFDNRVLIGTFLFLQGTMEDLKSVAINLMRIKSLTSTQDYVVPKEIKAELNQETYYPENYFINYLGCIDK